MNTGNLQPGMNEKVCLYYDSCIFYTRGRNDLLVFTISRKPTNHLANKYAFFYNNCYKKVHKRKAPLVDFSKDFSYTCIHIHTNIGGSDYEFRK